MFWIQLLDMTCIHLWMDTMGHNQVKMAEEDKRKIVFILERGTHAYNIMPFGLCINAPTTF